MKKIIILLTIFIIVFVLVSVLVLNNNKESTYLQKNNDSALVLNSIKEPVSLSDNNKPVLNSGDSELMPLLENNEPDETIIFIIVDSLRKDTIEDNNDLFLNKIYSKSTILENMYTVFSAPIPAFTSIFVNDYPYKFRGTTISLDNKINLSHINNLKIKNKVFISITLIQEASEEDGHLQLLVFYYLHLFLQFYSYNAYSEQIQLLALLQLLKHPYELIHSNEFQLF